MIDLTQLTVTHKLGEGSQGKVFLATDPEGARFAVKLVVLDEHTDRKLIFERATAFRPEQLDQMIVPILSHGMVSNTPAALARQLGRMSKEALLLVTPFIAGTTLEEIEAQGPLTLKEAVAALAGIGAALNKLPAGVGHGDLRAPNIFVRPTGELALGDPDLSSNPNPSDDVRALAAIGLNLAKLAPPDPNTRAMQLLQTLIGDIARASKPLEAGEVASRLREIAILLGAPAANVTSVLAKRVQAVERARSEGPLGTGTATVGRGRARPWIMAAIALALLLLAAATLLASTRRRTGQVSAVQASGDSPGAAAADSLYDTTGTVHYDEPIHPLGKHEHLAATDGLVQLDFEYSIARIAILSARKELLWELRKPPSGGSVYLNARPGHYFIEEDRDLGDAGMQEDRRLVDIDRQHPQRVTTTREIVNSPQRPEK